MGESSVSFDVFAKGRTLEATYLKSAPANESVNDNELLTHSREPDYGMFYRPIFSTHLLVSILDPIGFPRASATRFSG